MSMARLVHLLIEECAHCGAVEVACEADVSDDPERYSYDIHKVTCPRCNPAVRRKKRKRKTPRTPNKVRRRDVIRQ